MPGTIIEVRGVTKSYRMRDVSVNALFGAIARGNRELCTTTAVITHNTAIAAMADRVLQPADGRIAEERRHECRSAPEALRW